MVSEARPRATLAGAFDNLSSLDVRLLKAASAFGALRLRVYDDALIHRVTGLAPKFPLVERLYALTSVRYVEHVEVLDSATDPADPAQIFGDAPEHIVSTTDTRALRAFALARGVKLDLIDPSRLTPFPTPAPCPDDPKSDRKKVLVTGCFDWLHTGHVRFCEEVSGLGDLYVVVGSDANIRLLKGAGKPMFPEAQRCYTANAIRFVKQAMVSSGRGWLDAEPEVKRLRPDAYAVNEDGDVPEKRAFCATHGIEYIVLKRLPRPGLEARSSTSLRGF